MDITDEDELYRSAEENGEYDDVDEYIDDDGDADDAPSMLLRLIQIYDWAGTLARISSHPSECLCVGMQGRAPLHFACDQDAPAVVVQALLKAYPEASVLTGTTNMNPLHITCSSKHASVHVVRVLLECGRFEQFSMRDVDGDTPLHAACRCGAPIDVLEVLLRSYTAAVCERDYEGLTPVQRLWVRYFVILGDDIIESVNCAADLVGELLEAWNKTELLLRCACHGHLDNTRFGGKILFRAVHAAAAVDCPRSVVKIATKVYPHQIEERDENGNTPLMIAAKAPIYKVRDLSDGGYSLEDLIYEGNTADTNNLNGFDYAEVDLEGGNGAMYASVIEILLQAASSSPTHLAHLPDPSGRLPLHLALVSGKRWNEGIKHLIDAYPDAVGLADRSSKLYPFMLAACSINQDVTTIYEILRLNPSLICDLLKKGWKVPQNPSISKKFDRPDPADIETPYKLFEATRL